MYKKKPTKKKKKKKNNSRHFQKSELNKPSMLWKSFAWGLQKKINLVNDNILNIMDRYSLSMSISFLLKVLFEKQASVKPIFCNVEFF
jgi:hypothetical protein